MGTGRLTICFELLQKLRARLESRLTGLNIVGIFFSKIGIICSLKVKAFGKLRRMKKFYHHVFMHAGKNLFLCVGLLAENYVLDRM